MHNSMFVINVLLTKNTNYLHQNAKLIYGASLITDFCFILFMISTKHDPLAIQVCNDSLGLVLPLEKE